MCSKSSGAKLPERFISHRNRSISNSQETGLYQKLVNCYYCCHLWSYKRAQSWAVSSRDQRGNRCFTWLVPFSGWAQQWDRRRLHRQGIRKELSAGESQAWGIPVLYDALIMCWLMLNRDETCQILLASYRTRYQSSPSALVAMPLLFKLRSL